MLFVHAVLAANASGASFAEDVLDLVLGLHSRGCSLNFASLTWVLALQS